MESLVTLYNFQQEALNKTANDNKVAYYYDMGLGKTFIGSEKCCQLDEPVTIVVCQKSKVNDWLEHFTKFYTGAVIYDLTSKKLIPEFLQDKHQKIGVINYDLLWRRPELSNVEDFTLMLDESSLIQNAKTKRTKFIQGMKYKNLVLLSGTPVSGKYEKLYTQCRMLGWNITYKDFWNRYVIWHDWDAGTGFPIPIVTGYKNVSDLKYRLNAHGAIFKKSDEVYELPSKKWIEVKIPMDKHQRKFLKDKFVQKQVKDFIPRQFKDYVGDTTLKAMLCQRQLANSADKQRTLKELLESTEDRVIVFYNFEEEKHDILEICQELHKPISVVCGSKKDLSSYENDDNSITLVQYQAGAMGLNLQNANRIIYYSPTLSADLWMQSQKRIHRIGQTKPCFYYKLVTMGSVEEHIYKSLERGEDYTNELFKRSDFNGKVSRYRYK